MYVEQFAHLVDDYDRAARFFIAASGVELVEDSASLANWIVSQDFPGIPTFVGIVSGRCFTGFMVVSLSSLGSGHRLGEDSVLEDLAVVDAGIDDALLLRAEVLIEWVEENEVPAEPDRWGAALAAEGPAAAPEPPTAGVDELGPRRLHRGLDGVLPARPVAIAGDGTPMVSDMGLVDLAATLRRSVVSTTRLVGGICELAYRLPRIWARCRGGGVALWRALRVAEKTSDLPWTVATEVDAETVSTLGSCSWAQVDRCVQAALARHEAAERDADTPDGTGENADGAAADDDGDARKIRVFLNEAGTDPGMLGAGGIGLTGFEGTIDDADALDLEGAIRNIASDLAKAGSTDPLDVRRAKAVGLLARGEAPLPTSVSAAASPDGTSTPASGTSSICVNAPPGSRRKVRLVLHLTDTAMFGADAVGRCENTLAPASLDQIKSWCAGARVTVQPVLDVADHHPVGTYEIPDHLRAQVHYRDVECVFPDCHRPARSCDLDHIIPYPEGPTCACNLVPLCRRHHRAKTARRWSYVMVHPGCYYWRSPAGGTYLVDSHGTHALPDLSEAGAAARFRRPCIADISDRINAPDDPALPGNDGRRRQLQQPTARTPSWRASEDPAAPPRPTRISHLLGVPERETGATRPPPRQGSPPPF